MLHILRLASLLAVLSGFIAPYSARTTERTSRVRPRVAKQAAVNHQVYLPTVETNIPPIIPPTTTVVDATTLQDLIAVSPDNKAFTFANHSPVLQSLESGDIIVGDVTAAAKNGFLRKVSSVTQQNGTTVVETTDATLEEAVTDGVVALSRSLTPDDVQTAHIAPGVRIMPHVAATGAFTLSIDNVVLYDHDRRTSTTGDQIRADGSVKLEPAFDFSLAIDDGHIKDLTLKQTTSETGQLEIYSEVEVFSVSGEKELAHFTFSPITVFVGPVPVVFTPVLSVYVGMNGDFRLKVATSVTQEATMTAGLRYQNGSWSPIRDFNNTFTFTPPTLSASLEIKQYAGPKLMLLLYGVVGPSVAMHEIVALEADTTDTPWWQLYAGLEATAGIQVRVLSRLIADYEAVVLDVRRVLAQAQDNPPIPPLPIGTTRVSVASDGSQANQDAYGPSISADGRYVVFESHASNLVPNDTNTTTDVFVHDRQTRQTTRVSVASNGVQNNGPSYQPTISSDGRYVTFGSHASNLVPGDTNNQTDIFVHDRQTRETSRVSITSNGAQSNGISEEPIISADGRYIAFLSLADNLVTGDTNNKYDVFVHDRQTRETSRVSIASDGSQGNQRAAQPSISTDGRYVAFVSNSDNLVPGGNTQFTTDVFVHDRQTRQTTRISINSNGSPGNNSSYLSHISGDGRYVAFTSWANNLVPGDTNNQTDNFVHDRQTRQTTRVSIASVGSEGNGGATEATISADGRYVAFVSTASNLVDGDTNREPDLFVHDRQTKQTTRVSVASDGTQSTLGGWGPSISANGHAVVFTSHANNLVSNDTNLNADVFVHQLSSTP